MIYMAKKTERRGGVGLGFTKTKTKWRRRNKEATK